MMGLYDAPIIVSFVQSLCCLVTVVLPFLSCAYGGTFMLPSLSFFQLRQHRHSPFSCHAVIYGSTAIFLSVSPGAQSFSPSLSFSCLWQQCHSPLSFILMPLATVSSPPPPFYFLAYGNTHFLLFHSCTYGNTVIFPFFFFLSSHLYQLSVVPLPFFHLWLHCHSFVLLPMATLSFSPSCSLSLWRCCYFPLSFILSPLAR